MSRNLNLKGITYRYSSAPGSFILGPMDISILRGQLIFWVGGNGSGKSTLGKIIAGEIAPSSGSIGSATIGSAIYYSQSLSDNIFSTLRIGEHYQLLAGDRTESLKALYQSFPELTLLKNRYPDELSGGQLQLAAFATLMLAKRNIYVFDEIFNHLHPDVSTRIMRYISDLARQDDTSVVIISHSFDLVHKYGDGAYIFHNGSLRGYLSKKDFGPTPTSLMNLVYSGDIAL